MSEFKIKLNETVGLVVTARESDTYSGSAFFKLEKEYADGSKTGANEAFLSPIMLEQLGRHLIAQAEAIRLAQQTRDKPLSV